MVHRPISRVLAPALLAGVAAVVTVPVATGVALAEVTLSFTWGRPSVGVPAGGSATIPLYLTETVSGASTSILAGENGLSSVGVSVTRSTSSVPAPTDPAFMNLAGLSTNTSDFADSGDPIFGPELSVSPAGNLAQVLVFARDAGVVGTPQGAGVRRVLIGTVTFRAGAVPGERTVFDSGDYDPNSSDTITWQSFLVLDGQITGSSISINTLGPCDYDFNQDENADLLDAQQMAQVFVGLIPFESGWLSGDLNNDENADLTDAQLLAAYLVSGVCPL
jgi:hypothetical protein